MTDSSERKPLPWKQRRFVEEYPVDQNGAAAAVRAGYSASRAKQTAWRLLRKPAVQEALAEVQDALTKRSEANQDWIIKHLPSGTTIEFEITNEKVIANHYIDDHSLLFNGWTKAMCAVGLPKPFKPNSVKHEEKE